MPNKTATKSITIRLDPQFAEALRFYKTEDIRHLTIAEQVRRALICYWQAQHTFAGMQAVGTVLPGYEEGDAEFGFVEEQS
jgi:hypothetical protein